MKLLITEKPSQCRDIAAAMGYAKSGKFFAGPDIICAPAVGHLLEQVEPEKVIAAPSWSDPASLLPLPRRVPLTPIAKTKGALDDIRTLMAKAEGVIIATDPDREGEGIGREILDYLKWTGPVQRLWLVGGMDKTSIQKAMKALRRGDETVGMYRAQQARALSDWTYMLVTMATTAAGQHGAFGPTLGLGKGREGVVSVGRVQTPTLAMVVRRDLAIEHFTPVDHFSVYLDLDQDGHAARLDYTPTVAESQLDVPHPGVVWQESPARDGKSKPLFVDEARVDAFTDRVQALGTLSLQVERKDIRKLPPRPYSMTTLQQQMNKRFKMTAKATLAAAQALYEAGVLSYPRTERDAWPQQLFEDDARDVIRALERASDPTVARVARELEFPAKAPSAYTTKPQEHYALMPTRKVPQLESLDPDQRNVWLTVARRYLEAHLPAAQGTKTTLSARLPVEGLIEDRPALFQSSKEVITQPGWITAFNEAPDTHDPLAALHTGEAAITESNASASQTSPPTRYTEATLIADMKAAAKFAANASDAELLKAVTGIGTPATRDAIIEGLLRRGYLERQKTALVSTPKGRDLVAHAHPLLTQVEMTAQWESRLGDIESMSPADAEAARNAFVEAQAQFSEQIIRDCITRISTTAKRPYTPAPGTKPSPKMIAFAESLATRKGIPLPKGLKSDAAICSAFLEAHAGPRPPRDPSAPAPSSGPSEKQLAFMDKIAARKGIEIPPQARADRSAASRWIDTHNA